VSELPCTPDVVLHQVGIEAFCVRPDGLEIAYVRRHVEDNAYRSHLWAQGTDGSRARQLTDGRVRDSSPDYSPDGNRLAFVRTPDSADHGQAWVLDFDGSEGPRPLPTLPHGVSSLSWSPDGQWLALVAPSATEVPFIVGPEIHGKTPLARRITRLDWRDDDAGHRDRRSHLFVLRPDGEGSPRQVTRGDWDVANPTWSPDSRRIAFDADMRSDRDLDPRQSVYVVEIETGELRLLAELSGDAAYSQFSPDGRRLAFLGRDIDDAPEYVTYEPWVVPAVGGQPTKVEFAGDAILGTWAWSELDLVDGWPGPSWLDESTLVGLLSERARSVPYSVSIGGGKRQRLVADDRVQASGVAVAAGRVFVSAAVDGRAGEIYEVADDRLRRLTSDGSEWQSRYQLPEISEIEIPGPGGAINAWLVSPAGAEDRALPLIVHFHGGPTGSYGPGSSLDAMVWTSAGYRVVMPNVRGSATFGYEWAHALNGRWGEVDVADALAVVDWLVERGVADPRRLGLYGLSYGGFLVQALVGITSRFAAAVAENGVSNQVSAWANSYFGVYWNRRMGVGDPLTHDGMLKLWASSPLSRVANITTPLLILQAEDDRVCPAADNEQLFTALRALGREVEYVLYPEEHHEMKIYGRPDRRIDRHERMLAWFSQHMQPTGTRLPTDASVLDGGAAVHHDR
jgi:dipeptidyl aminopeptidase/acylaminoacyl peptidase